MAIVTNPLLQGCRGLIGDLVYYQYQGKTCIRRRPHPSTKPCTPRQAEQRERIASIAMFYRAIEAAGLYPIWQKAMEKQINTGYNLFVQRNLPAFNGQGTISDFNKIQVSTGSLQLPDQINIHNDDDGEWILEWENQFLYPGMGEDDCLKVVLMKCATIYTVKTLTTDDYRRSDCQAILHLPPQLKDYPHLFCYFCSATGEKFSVSRYYCLT